MFMRHCEYVRECRVWCKSVKSAHPAREEISLFFSSFLPSIFLIGHDAELPQLSVIGAFMKTKSLVLIDGSYEVVNSPDRLVVFDIRNPRKDEKGSPVPVEIIPLRGPVQAPVSGAFSFHADSDSFFIRTGSFTRPRTSTEILRAFFNWS
jgi:hypothetical protein